MPKPTQQPPGQPTPTPVVMDLHAAAPQLLARAAQDYAAARSAASAKQAQGIEVREGVLHGEGGN